jgi:tetratricopeptide (TPR) repeat protein
LESYTLLTPKQAIMKNMLLALLLFGMFSVTHAQLTTLPNGGNKKASVSEWVGITNVAITYNRPGVKGREGQIWGKLVATGYTDQGYGTSKAAPWRAGANENTTIEFNTDVKIEGQTLPAGKYALFIAYDPAECTLIFSRNYSSWGSFFYDPREDALQVKVKPVALDNSVEWLRYEFKDQKESSATIALEWEKVSIPFKVETDYIQTQLATFRRELRSDKGFTWNAWVTAAQFCIQHNTDLDEALDWSNTAISGTFIGQKNFQTLSTKAQVLALQGKSAEADAVMKEALPLGQMADVHQYARMLLTQKRSKEAFDAFKLNYDRHPNEFTTNMGMARAWSAMGDYKKALAFIQKAQPQAPDKMNKDNVDKSLKMLQEGKDIN